MGYTLSELRVRATYDQKDFKAALDRSKQDMRDAGRTIKQEAEAAEAAVKASSVRMGSAYATLPQAARRAYDEALNAQRDYHQKVAQGMTQVGVAMSVGITLPFAMFAKDAIQLGATFEQTMDIVQASIQGTQRQMDALAREAVALGADITLPATSAVDAARAMNQLAKGGLEAEQVLRAARGTMQLAAAAGVDAAEAATIEARALAQFNLDGSQAAHVADLLAKATYSATGTIQDMSYALQASGAVMKQAGQSIDDTMTAITLMAKAGIVGSDAGTSLKQMFLRLEEGGSMRRVRDLLHGYGIEIYDAAGKMKDMRGIIAEFAPMMEHLTEKQRNAALAIIFGSDAIRSANIILGGGVQAFDEMRAKLEQEGAAADLAAARNKGLAGAIDGLKSAWETLAQQSAEGILQPLASLTRGVAEFVGVLAGMNPTLRGIILTLGALAAASGPVLIGVAQMKMAWVTLFGIRSAATAAAATAAAAETALAAAESAQAASATQAAAAETALNIAQAQGAVAATTAVASKTSIVVWNEAVAASAMRAASATGTAGVATAAGARGVGLLGGAMTLLSGPVGLAIIGIAGLSAAIYGMYKWSQVELDQAKEREQQFKNDAQATYEAAKAKVELAKQTRPLLAEYEELAKKQQRSNTEQKRYQDVANQLSLLMPDLVKGYRATGDAILDVAKAHKEAAAQAQHQYDREMALAQSRLSIISMGDAAQRAANLREQGAGRSLAELEKAVTWDAKAQGGMGWFKYDENVISDTIGSPIADALRRRIRANQRGDSQAYDEATRDLLKSMRDLNETLRKVEALQAQMQRQAKEEHRKSELGPEGYARYQAQQEKARREAEWKAEAEKRKADQVYQKEKDAWFKSHGYTSIEELAKTPRTRKAAAEDADLTAKVLEAMAKKIQTPEGAASCGYFAMAILKQTGAAVGDGRYYGGAQALVRRVRAAGGVDVTASQARAGDLVYYHGKGYGAGGSGYHVGVYEGGGYVVDSSGTGPGNQRTRHPLNAGAHFIRPMRTGRWDNQGDTALDALQRAEAEAKRLAEAQKQQQQELAEAYRKTQVAMAAMVDPNVRYAELLGIQLDRYKKLTPEEKARAERLYAMRSAITADQELARMQRGASIEAMTDPVARAVAQYGQQLADRRDLTDQDRARLIEEKRAELVAQRGAEIAKEVQRLTQEKALVEAITEQERIRLRLMQSRPDLQPGELETLAKAEYARYQAEQAKAVQGDVDAKTKNVEAAKAQLAHDQALHDIAANLRLAEEQRYRLIQDQNDALALQLYTLQQMARVEKSEITPEQAKQLIQAEQQQIQAERATRDQVEMTRQLEEAQRAVADKTRARMDAMADSARDQAEALTSVLMRPFEDGLDKGLKGFWNSLVEGWRQVVRQMFLDWMKSQLMRSLRPLFEGGELKAYQAGETAKQVTKDQGQEALVRAARGATDAAQKLATAGGTGIPQNAGGWTAGGKINPMGMMVSLAALFGGGKHTLLQDLVGIVGLLGSLGAFNKGGFLSKMHFAAGGDMPYGMPALVGEFGPELWMPPSSGGRIHNASETEQMLAAAAGGGQNITVVQNIQTPDVGGFRRSAGQIASQMREELDRRTKRNFIGR